MTPVVAVLAGGRGRRLSMGRNAVGEGKASVMLNGRPLISYPLRAAREAGLKAAVVAKRDSDLPPLEVPVINEPDDPRHPLCGVVAALRAAGPGGSLVAGCDMPFLTASLLRWLARRAGDVVVGEVGGMLQPFPGVYRPAATATLEEALRSRLSLRATLEVLAPEVIGEEALRAFGDPARLCFSVNDPQDLETARAWIGGS